MHVPCPRTRSPVTRSIQRSSDSQMNRSRTSSPTIAIASLCKNRSRWSGVICLWGVRGIAEISIEWRPDASISYSGRIARTGAGRHCRRRARRPAARGRRSLDPDLRRRQLGYGRGRRMAIEPDRAEILSGVRRGRDARQPDRSADSRIATGTNWQHTMSVEAEPPTRARARGARRSPGRVPGTPTSPARPEVRPHRSARHPRARERPRNGRARGRRRRRARASRAVSASVASHVIEIGGAALADPLAVTFARSGRWPRTTMCGAWMPRSRRRCAQGSIAAKEAGDTVGGAFEVIAHGVPPGLGSHVQWDRKLDGLLAQALMSIPAIKAVGIGRGAASASLPGSRFTTRSCRPASPSGTVPASPADQ